MVTITTKYSVGDKVYIVTSRDMGSIFDVELKQIASINVGGKVWDRYTFDYNTNRSESDVYTDIEKAKAKAKESAKAHYERNLENIDKIDLDEPTIAGGHE